MIIYMNLCETKGILGSWFSYINIFFFLNKNFGSFSADFQFQAEGKKVTSRAELKILQLKLWLEPARLGLITNTNDKTKRWQYDNNYELAGAA